MDKTAIQKWEYAAVTWDSDDELNLRGARGWEVIHITPPHYNADGSYVRGGVVYKRPLDTVSAYKLRVKFAGEDFGAEVEGI